MTQTIGNQRPDEGEGDGRLLGIVKDPLAAAIIATVITVSLTLGSVGVYIVAANGDGAVTCDEEESYRDSLGLVVNGFTATTDRTVDIAFDYMNGYDERSETVERLGWEINTLKGFQVAHKELDTPHESYGASYEHLGNALSHYESGLNLMRTSVDRGDLDMMYDAGDRIDLATQNITSATDTYPDEKVCEEE